MIPGNSWIYTKQIEVVIEWFLSQMPVNIENCMKCDLIHGKSVTLTNPEKQRQAFWVEIIS